MIRVKKASKTLIALCLTLFLLVTMLPAIFDGMNAGATTFDGRKHRLGCWWWYFADATNTTTRDNYLGLLEETGVTEIYLEAYTQLWTPANHITLHNFVMAAQKHGMRTSVMIDDPALATSASTAARYINNLYTGWVSYKNAYPDDWLYGIHFDVEPGGYNTTVLQNYCNNLLKNALETLVANNVYVEFDVNPAWEGAESVTYNGTSNFYQILAKELGGGKGTVSLMSYRTTGAKVMSRANERKAIDYAVQYNCDFTYGIETDKVDSAIDISNRTKSYLCEMLDYIYGQIDSKNYPMDAGVAIHHARAYYTYLSGTLPTTSVYVQGGTTASRPTYTTKPTQPTKPHTGTLTKTAVWEGDLNATVIIENYIGILNNAEVDAAIRADLAKNGTISDDEYYEIFTTGYMQGDSGYAVAGFLTGELEFWGDDKAQFCATIGESQGLTCQKCIGTATDKKGNLLAPDLDGSYTQLAYFSDADGYKDKVYITHLEINVYRYSGDSPATTTPSQQTQPIVTVPSQQTQPIVTVPSQQTQPIVTVPSQQTQPIVTVPSVVPTEPIVTDPSSSEPIVTDPSSSEPIVTEPSSSEPIVTEPSATGTETIAEPTATETMAEPTATETVFDPTATGIETTPDPTGTNAEPTGMPIEILYGDANDDGEVNMKDVLTARMYVADIPVYINLVTTDVNRDGAVNMKDILYIRMYIANLISSFDI